MCSKPGGGTSQYKLGFLRLEDFDGRLDRFPYFSLERDLSRRSRLFDRSERYVLRRSATKKILKSYNLTFFPIKMLLENLTLRYSKILKLVLLLKHSILTHGFVSFFFVESGQILLQITRKILYFCLIHVNDEVVSSEKSHASQVNLKKTGNTTASTSSPVRDIFISLT